MTRPLTEERLAEIESELRPELGYTHETMLDELLAEILTLRSERDGLRWWNLLRESALALGCKSLSDVPKRCRELSAKDPNRVA